MDYDGLQYIQLYKIKAGLLKQIKELDVLIDKLKPKDFILLSKLVNEITLGVHEYPFNGLLNDKIFFTLSQLKAANVKDIKRYMEIIGDKDVLYPSFEDELSQALRKLESHNFLITDKTLMDIDIYRKL